MDPSTFVHSYGHSVRVTEFAIVPVVLYVAPLSSVSTLSDKFSNEDSVGSVSTLFSRDYKSLLSACVSRSDLSGASLSTVHFPRLSPGTNPSQMGNFEGHTYSSSSCVPFQPQQYGNSDA